MNSNAVFYFYKWNESEGTKILFIPKCDAYSGIHYSIHIYKNYTYHCCKRTKNVLLVRLKNLNFSIQQNERNWSSKTYQKSNGAISWLPQILLDNPPLLWFHSIMCFASTKFRYYVKLADPARFAERFPFFVHLTKLASRASSNRSSINKYRGQ